MPVVAAGNVVWESWSECGVFLAEGSKKARTALKLSLWGNGAEDGIRTRDPHLGKVMLYH